MRARLFGLLSVMVLSAVACSADPSRSSATAEESCEGDSCDGDDSPAPKKKKRDAGVQTSESDDDASPDAFVDSPDSDVPDVPLDASTRDASTPDVSTTVDAKVVDAKVVDAPLSPPDSTSPVCQQKYFLDLDGDGYGSATWIQSCTKPAGYSGLTGDCEDQHPDVHPNQMQTFAQPFTRSAGGLSFDYDCDGKEEPATVYQTCHTGSGTGGWSNGRVCSTYAQGEWCTHWIVATGRVGATLNQQCGATLRRCEYDKSIGWTWAAKNPIPCN